MERDVIDGEVYTSEEHRKRSAIILIYSAGEFCHSDVINFAHALVIYRTSSMRARILTQKSEEANAFSASLLATPLISAKFGTRRDLKNICLFTMDCGHDQE